MHENYQIYLKTIFQNKGYLFGDDFDNILGDLTNIFKYVLKEGNFSGITYFVIILTYISSVFFASVIIDKGRIAVFNHIWNKYEKHKCRNDHP